MFYRMYGHLKAIDLEVRSGNQRLDRILPLTSNAYPVSSRVRIGNNYYPPPEDLILKRQQYMTSINSLENAKRGLESLVQELSALSPVAEIEREYAEWVASLERTGSAP